MNITLNVTTATIERLVTALERIADAVERIAGPQLTIEQAKPYDRDYWMESSNANAIAIEAEERREAEGHEPEFDRELESIARAAYSPEGDQR